MEDHEGEFLEGEGFMTSDISKQTTLQRGLAIGEGSYDVHSRATGNCRMDEHDNDSEDWEEVFDQSAMQLDDKASFREKASFLKVLEDSSKFRSRLPEPKGAKQTKLAGIEQRPFPTEIDEESILLSPRKQGRTLYKGHLLRNRTEAISPRKDGSRGEELVPLFNKVKYETSNNKKSVANTVSLPPVTGSMSGPKPETRRYDGKEEKNEGPFPSPRLRHEGESPRLTPRMTTQRTKSKLGLESSALIPRGSNGS